MDIKQEHRGLNIKGKKADIQGKQNSNRISGSDANVAEQTEPERVKGIKLGVQGQALNNEQTRQDIDQSNDLHDGAITKSGNKCINISSMIQTWSICSLTALSFVLILVPLEL